jgi:hypothetical protein
MIILKQLIVRDVYNYFIGYGSKHDSGLLRTLSDFEKILTLKLLKR